MDADNFMWFADSPSSGGGSAGGSSGDEVQVEGETTDAWFTSKKAFELSKFSFSLKQSDVSVAKSSDGSDGGRAKFQAFTVDKPVDLASVSLYKACSLGKRFDNAFVAVRKAGGNNLLYIQYLFREVSVTGITWNGGEGQKLPTESVTFEFEAMGFQYVQQQASGGRQGKRLLWSWNAKNNQPGLNIPGLGPPPMFVSALQTTT